MISCHNYFLGTLDGLFSQICGESDVVREKCLKFMSSKIKALGREVIDKDSEDYLIAESKKILLQVSKINSLTKWSYI